MIIGIREIRDMRDKKKSKTGSTRFGIWYEKSVGKLIPKQTVVSLISCFVLNSAIYTGTQLLMKNAKHYDLSTKFDKSLPFVKEWIYIYLICFAFWAVNYIMISRTEREHWYKFATGDYLSRLICGVFFILLPTTNVRPEITGNGLSSILMRFVYTDVFHRDKKTETYTGLVQSFFGSVCGTRVCINAVYEAALYN